MKDVIQIPRHIAKMVCEMEYICFSEGQGPDNAELMCWIRKTYPGLYEEYSYIAWPAEQKT